MKTEFDFSKRCTFERWTYVGPDSVEPWDLPFRVFNEEYLGGSQDSTTKFTYCDFYQDGSFTNAVDYSRPYYCTGVNFGMPCKVKGALLYAIGDPQDCNTESSLLLVRRDSPALARFMVPKSIYIGGYTSADDQVEYHFRSRR